MVNLLSKSQAFLMVSRGTEILCIQKGQSNRSDHCYWFVFTLVSINDVCSSELVLLEIKWKKKKCTSSKVQLDSRGHPAGIKENWHFLSTHDKTSQALSTIFSKMFTNLQKLVKRRRMCRKIKRSSYCKLVFCCCWQQTCETRSRKTDGRKCKNR